jgi:methylphosphotriester-DNA--protein-cysteine methyltransferase
VTKLGPFVINARSGKVHHRPRCRYAGRVLAEPLLIEATTTYEACQQIVEVGLNPCNYCFPWRERLDPGRRYIARERRSSESEQIDELWEIVDTSTNEVVDTSGSARWAVITEREWNEALESDPAFTPRRYEAKRRLQEASARRRYAESQWQNAIREMHEAGFSLGEIAAVARVAPSDIAALISASPPSA